MVDTLHSGTPDIEEDFDPVKVGDVATTHAVMREQCPVAHVRSGTAHFALTRYADVTAAARDTAGFANGKRTRFISQRPPLEADPPEHTLWRKLLNPFFSARRIEQMFEPVSRKLALALIEPLVAAAGGGDAAHDLARPLPPQVLLSFLGQPLADWPMVKDCCELAYLDRSNDPGDRAKFDAANDTLWNYSRRAVAARIEAPADPVTDLVAGLLLGARELENGAELVAGVVRLLLAAGHDSTTSALSICLHYLARSPDDQARLRAEPQRLRVAIEEMLRFETPVIAMGRTLAHDMALQGKALQPGDRAMLYFAAANRDPAAFTDPDRCLIDRTPNPHLAFGIGIHSCVGAPLARQEIRVALEELLRRARSFTLAGPVSREFWHPYGLRHLPLHIEAE